MYYVYVLKSFKDGGYYTGSTDDIVKRLRQHNEGLNTSTRHRRPLEVVFKKEFETREEALRFERLLKRQKGGEGFRRLTRLE